LAAYELNHLLYRINSYLAITSWPSTTGRIGHCWTMRDELASFHHLWATTTTN